MGLQVEKSQNQLSDSRYSLDEEEIDSDEDHSESFVSYKSGNSTKIYAKLQKELKQFKDTLA
jgi:hypothetical protein